MADETKEQDAKLRVLAVDDTDDVLELVRFALGPSYLVVTLNDPVDLYGILDVLEPDLLILDIMMPRINGFQLIEMLRRNADTRDLPIMILSAKSSAGEIKHGYRLGASMYLTKPFQPDRLRKNIETHFKLHPPARRARSIADDRLAHELQKTTAFRKKHLLLGDGLTDAKPVFDARRMVMDRIRRQDEAKKGL